MEKLISKKSAVRHLIMLAITIGSCAVSYTILWIVRREIRTFQISKFMALALVIASASASIPVYWGSRKLLPVLAPKLWKAFLEALFSLPILNWFAPKSAKQSHNYESVTMQIEKERMRSFKQLRSNHSPGLAAANMGLSTDEDFLLNLIFKPVVFVLYLVMFLILHISYLCVAVGAFTLLMSIYQTIPEVGIWTVTILLIGVLLLFIVHPILSIVISHKHVKSH